MGSFAAVGDTGDAGGAAAASPAVNDLDGLSAFTPRYRSNSSGGSQYVVGPGDVLEITVFQVDELSRHVQVGGNNAISLPLIGRVEASGRTTQQIEDEIAGKLAQKYMNSPQVSVFVKEFNSKKVTVNGAVRKPGIITMKGDLSLMEAIAQAEGLDTVANPANVIVLRQVNGRRYAARFNINDIRDSKAQDPLLQDGDNVIVDASGVKTALRDFASPVASGGTVAAAARTFW